MPEMTTNDGGAAKNMTLRQHYAGVALSQITPDAFRVAWDHVVAAEMVERVGAKDTRENVKKMAMHMVVEACFEWADMMIASDRGEG